MKIVVVSSTTALAVALLASAASAQSVQPTAPIAPPTNATAPEPAVQLEEIVVTAEKRQSRLQDVPMSISAFNLADTRAAGINNTQDLQLRVPGLVYGAENGFAQPYIRGVGTAFASTGLETSIATYVDDVYIQQQTGAVTQLIDLAQVEVLKGPQGTLYGRNATGGAIIVRTQDPGDKFEGRLLAGYGRFGRVRAEGVLNAPLSSTISIRLAGSLDNRTDGYIRNVATGNDLGTNQQYTARAKIAWRPDPDTEVIASVETARNRDKSLAHRQGDVSVCTVCNLFGYTPPSGFYEVGLNTETNTQSDYTLGIVRASHDFGSLKLSSVTSYRDYVFSGRFDQDFTPIDLLNYVTRNASRTFEQELRLASQFAGPLNFIVGGFYEHDRSSAPASLPGLAFGTPAPAQTKNLSLLNAASVFGELYYSITPELKLTVGGRYNYDDRRLESANNPQAAAVFGSTGFDVSRSFRNFTPRAVLAYNKDDVNLYASYSRGFKSGGFNALVFAQPEAVKPEKLTSVEVGGKFDLLDRRLRLNVSAFHYKYDQIQVTFYDPVTSAVFLRNAASSTVYGADMEVALAVTQALRLSVGGSYLHARFDDFPSGSIYVPSGGSYVVQQSDLSGYRLPYSPTLSGFVSATYSAPLTERLNFDLTGLASYSDDYDFIPAAGGPLRNDKQRALTRVNLTGGITTSDKTWRVAFYIENLTNKRYFNARLPVGFGDQQQVALPRTFGGSIEYRF